MFVQVREFARIPLLCISSISYGTFILSTLSSFARDPVENYGFVLHYNLLPGEGEAVEEKSNTYSVRTTKDPDSPMPATTAGRAVFKAMRRDMVIEASSREKERTGEATVKAVLDQIQKQVSSLGGEVEHIEQDVRSLDTALRSESLFGKILHSIVSRSSMNVDQAQCITGTLYLAVMLYIVLLYSMDLCIVIPLGMLPFGLDKIRCSLLSTCPLHQLLSRKGEQGLERDLR